VIIRYQERRRSGGPDVAVPTPSGALGRGRVWRTRWHRLDVRASPYLYVAPFFVIFGLFGLFPLLYTAYVSLNKWNLLDPGGHQWVGLANYSKLLGDPYFWNALRNTISLWILSTVPQLVIALGLAQLLNYRMRGRMLFLVAILLPNVTSVVAVTLVFGQLFGRDFGTVNWVLGPFGFQGFDWRADMLASHVAIASIVTWRWAGCNTVILLAAMQTIPGELYEAAAIDGASRWQQFRHITIPMLRPAIIFVVIIATVGNMQLLAEPLLFDPIPGSAAGGSAHQFQTLGLYLYQQGFTNFRFGYAAAIAWTLFLIIMVSVFVSYLVTRRIRDTG